MATDVGSGRCTILCQKGHVALSHSTFAKPPAWPEVADFFARGTDYDRCAAGCCKFSGMTFDSPLICPSVFAIERVSNWR